MRARWCHAEPDVLIAYVFMNYNVRVEACAGACVTSFDTADILMCITSISLQPAQDDRVLCL